MKFNLLRFTNAFILIAMTLLTLTGVYGLFWTLAGWTFELHRLLGWLLIAAIPWKTAISLNSLRRGLERNFDRGAVVVGSLVLSAASVMVILLGLAWNWSLGPAQLWLRQTAVSWHWMLALGLLPLFILHVWRRWPRPRKVDFTSRRAALKMLALGAATLGGWQMAAALAAYRQQVEAPRRYTGSRRDGYFSGNRFPVTNGIGEGDQPVDLDGWELKVAGAVGQPRAFRYPDLLDWPASEKISTLDCTLGWYTVQAWQGVPLPGLLELCAASAEALGVRMESVTGYARFLPMPEARAVLLATHVGGQPLEHVHGFPLRAVVPSRRGWHWVKWLSKIEVVALGYQDGQGG